MVSHFDRKCAGPWVRRVVRGGSALALFMAMLILPAAAAPQFQASLDRDTISLGETATLSMTFRGGDPGGQPNVPSIPGIQFGAQETSSQMSLIGSDFSSSTVYTLELQPTRTGLFTIPPLVVNVNGTRLVSRPLKLKVTQGNQPQPNNGEPLAAVVRRVPSATTHYI
jgi:hypothetical protein